MNYSLKGQFQEVSKQRGVDHLHQTAVLMGGGAVFFDYNNDGWEDLYATGGGIGDKLFRNLGDGSFYEITDDIGLGKTSEAFTSGVVAGDINNDGCRDLFVTTFDSKAGLLFLNNCDGTFTDISNVAGIVEEISSTGATFLDYNHDGFLDIYVINYLKESNLIKDEHGQVVGFDHTCHRNLFYKNNGDNTFSEISSELGIGNKGCGLAIAATDFDQDRDLDIYVANDFGAWVVSNTIYRNNFPSDSFRDVTQKSQLDTKIYAMGIAIGDYDEDGDFDYYITNLGRNVLLQNDGSQVFYDISSEMGVENAKNKDGENSTGWGTFFFDYDNDTDLDLFVSNGFVEAADFLNTTTNDPNVLYRNDGVNGFTDVSLNFDMADTSINRGAIYGDYDNDGDQDIFVVSLYADDTKGAHSLLYENINSGSNNWLKVKLEGTVCNRDALGAHLVLHAEGRSLIREISGGSSHASQNSHIVHFGLGKIEKIDSIRIYWPGGNTDIISDLQVVNQTIYFKEGTDSYLVAGCMDTDAMNYDPNTTYAYGCRYDVGCTNAESPNYDPNAVVDNGTCEVNMVTATADLNPKQNSIRIYPNPFGDQLTVELPMNYSNVSVEILDLYGRRIYYQQQIQSAPWIIDLKHLIAGVYLYVLTKDESKTILQGRIIKIN